MIERIQKELQSILPTGTIVIYDEAKMQNWRSLDYKDKTVVYLEEYRNGRYDTGGYGLFRVSELKLYIYDSGNGKPIDAIERETIRTRLEDKVVLPIINHFGELITDCRYNVGPSRWNSLETGISLNITIREEICQ